MFRCSGAVPGTVSQAGLCVTDPSLLPRGGQGGVVQGGRVSVPWAGLPRMFRCSGAVPGTVSQAGLCVTDPSLLPRGGHGGVVQGGREGFCPQGCPRDSSGAAPCFKPRMHGAFFDAASKGKRQLAGNTLPDDADVLSDFWKREEPFSVLGSLNGK